MTTHDRTNTGSGRSGFDLRLLISIILYLILIIPLISGCPPRVIIIDGEEIPYQEAASVTFSRAKKAHEEGNYEKAIEMLRDYISRFRNERNLDEARFILGKSYEALNRHTDARRVYESLIEKDPRSPYSERTFFKIGISYLNAEDYASAYDWLERAFSAARGNERMKAARLLVDVSREMENWIALVQWIGEIRRLSTDHETRSEADEILLDLIDRKLPHTGLAALRRDLPPDSPALPLVTMKIARIHFHQREYSLARDALKEYLSGWPGGVFADDAERLIERMARLSEVNKGTVGIILPLSGRAQPFGDAVMRGIGMAMDTGEGRDITLLIRDSEGDPDIASAAVEDLVLEENVIAIIGPLLSGTSMAAAAKAEELGVPLISLSRAEGLPQTGSWIFRNALSDASQARTLVDYAVSHLNARKFGILYPNHEYGRGLMNHFWDEVESRELEIRGAEIYDHDETTFQPIIRSLVGRHHLQYRSEYMQEVRRIRAEITDPIRRRRALTSALNDVLPIPDFDVLFVPDSYRTMGLIAPALAVEDVITNVCDRRDIERIKETTGRDDLTKVHLFGPNAWNHPELVTRGGRHVRCSVFVDGFFAESSRPETVEFVELYQQMHGAASRPDYLEALGYDTSAIAGTIIADKRPSGRSAFRDELFRIEFTGATGDTKFASDGESIKSLFLLTVDREDIVEIKMPETDVEEPVTTH